MDNNLNNTQQNASESSSTDNSTKSQQQPDLNLVKEEPSYYSYDSRSFDPYQKNNIRSDGYHPATGSVGNGYFGQAYNKPSTTPFSTPDLAAKPKERKPASKGFVVGAIAIGIAISFVANFAASLFISSLFSGNNGLTIMNGGNEVIIQHVQKGEDKPVINDKGSVAYVASLVSDTVVEVSTETVSTDSFYGQYITKGAGSGVIISSSADSGSYIITCAHVIQGANKITVKLRDGTVYEAVSFSFDTETDVGVIKLNVSGLPCATIGNYSDVVVGEEVIAIGNPLGKLGGSVTNGVVSALERDIIIDGTTYHLLQTNAEINPGNSGGGLFDTEGNLIGIVNAKSSAENVEGLGFAIPIDDAERIMTDLIEKGYVTGRVELGFELLEVLTQEKMKQYWLQYGRYFTDYGVYIITSESPDFQEGDLLVAINDDKISSLSDLKTALQGYEVDQTVTVTVSRITNKNKVQLFRYSLTLKEKTS